MLPAFVTNLLWGNPEENDALEKQSVVEHSVREAGDDWLLVDTAQRTTDSPASAHDSSCLNSECDGDSVISDASWVIMPAPTFRHTSNPQESNDTVHPLEDLLIEHPTMSVYHQHNTSALGNNINEQQIHEEGTNMNIRVPPEPHQQQRNQNHALVLLRNRQRHQLAVQMQIPPSLGPAKAPSYEDKPPRLTRRALKRHNTSTNAYRNGKHQGSRIAKCSFKAGRRRC